MKKIAILGASYLQQPLVEKANSLGHETHCFAWDDGKAVCKDVADYFYPISILDKEEILAVCKDQNIDAILTIATDICIPTIAYVAENLSLIGNSYPTAIVTTNKGAMRNCFAEHNIPSPKYNVIRSKDNLSQLDLSFPVIVKPTDRSGSLGVIKVSTPEELNEAVSNSIDYSLEKSCIVEEYIQGVEVSVETLSYNGTHKILNITDKTLTAEPYFVEIEHHQPSGLNDKIQDKIKKIAINTLNATNVQYGASHIEMKITSDNKVYVIEIGSRMGGDFIGSDLVQLSTGIDYVKAVIDIAIGDFNFENYSPTKIKYSGVYFLSKDTDYLLNYFNKNESYIVKKETLNDDLKFIKSSNDRSGYIIYQSDKKINLR